MRRAERGPCICLGKIRRAKRAWAEHPCTEHEVSKDEVAGLSIDEVRIQHPASSAKIKWLSFGEKANPVISNPLKITVISDTR